MAAALERIGGPYRAMLLRGHGSAERSEAGHRRRAGAGRSADGGWVKPCGFARRDRCGDFFFERAEKNSGGRKMAIRGRKPKPTGLKLVAGTDRADRRNSAEPKPDLSIPNPPAHLADAGKVEWGRVCEQLYRLGILSELDRAALAIYCQAYARWAQAETDLAEGGGQLVLETVSGNLIQNPLVGIANKAMADLSKYAADFGMNPSARSRIKADERGKEDDPATRYFG